MTTGPESRARQDQAVVLARGRSSRMGVPKGLVRLPDDGRPLLGRIVDLYREAGDPVLVLALAEAAAAYGEILGSRPGVEILPAAGGGGTARTLALAWSRVHDRCTHLWAHPVDLPLVRPETLARLREQSRVHSGRVIRPWFGESPGHPVVLPCEVLSALDAALKARTGPRPGGLFAAEEDLKEWLTPEWLGACGSGMEIVAVTDPGVIRDFDGPGPAAG